MHTPLLGRMSGPRRPIHVRLCIKKNQNAPILSEHPPVRRKIVKTFRWDQRLQIQEEKLERAYTFLRAVLNVPSFYFKMSEFLDT